MGSYQRFPKCIPSSEAAIRRDREWREAEFRRAMRLPKPTERIDTSKDFRLSVERFDISELLDAIPLTRH